MDFIRLLVAIFILTAIFYRFYYPKLRSFHVNLKLVKDGNPEMFLYELGKDINKAKSDEYKRALLVNKVSGLIFMGKWQEAIELLDTIGSNFNNEVFTVQYYLNYLSAHIFLERVDIAKEIYSDKKELFERYKTIKRYREINQSIKKVEGIFSFYNDDLIKSKSIFEELLDKQKYSIYRAIYHYFLGKIFEKEGNLAESKIHFNKAKLLGERTFLSKVVSE